MTDQQSEVEQLEVEHLEVEQFAVEQLGCRSATHGLDLRRLSPPIAMCNTDVYYIKALSFSHTACYDLMGATHSSVVQ